MNNFDLWFAELVLEADKYESGISMDKNAWKLFFDFGMTPKEALSEDVSNG